MTTEILSLTEIASSDAQKETLHNRALRELEGQLIHAKDKDLAAPPGSPAEGDVYIVAASPTGAWAGHAGDIAHFFGGIWKFHVKREGLRLWVDDEDIVYACDGSTWIAQPTGGGLPVADTTAIVKGSADATKLLRFEVGGFTPSTTRTVTPQDKDGIMALAGKPRVAAVPYAASIILDCSTADVFRIGTLTGNTTIAFSNASDGQKIQVITTQDATGGRTVSWDSAVTFGSDITAALAASAGPNKVDYFGVQFNNTASKYHMIAVARGY